MVFGLLKECIWSRATPRLLFKPGFELCLDTLVKPLKAQVLQHVLAVFQGRFAFRPSIVRDGGKSSCCPNNSPCEAIHRGRGTNGHTSVPHRFVWQYTKTLPIPCDFAVTCEKGQSLANSFRKMLRQSNGLIPLAR